MDIATAATFFGLIASGLLLAMLVWSIAVPDKRLWPPISSTVTAQFLVWVPTIAIFASAFVLGIIDWNRFEWPAWLRWGIGLPVIVICNWIVWRGVLKLGIATTSGAVGQLKTDGIYRYSRNPQYMADIGILVGWAILSGSGLTLPVAGAGILVLLIAPLAEEPWLAKIHGDAFKRYCNRTRRYL